MNLDNDFPSQLEQKPKVFPDHLPEVLLNTYLWTSGQLYYDLSCLIACLLN